MKTVRNVMACLLSLLLLTAVTSCSAKDQLQRAVEENNKQYPKDMGNGFEMTKMSIEDNQLLYIITIDEEKFGVPVTVLESQKETMKQSMGELVKKEPSVNKLSKLLIEVGIPIVFRYQNKDASSKVDINITVDELKELVK